MSADQSELFLELSAYVDAARTAADAEKWQDAYLALAGAMMRIQSLQDGMPKPPSGNFSDYLFLEKPCATSSQF